MTDLPSCVYAGQHISPMDGGIGNMNPIGIGTSNPRVNVPHLPRTATNLCTLSSAGGLQHHHQYNQIPQHHHHHHHTHQHHGGKNIFGVYVFFFHRIQ